MIPERACVLDLETRSTEKLGRGGTNPYTYAEHENTGVWFATYGFDDDPDTVLTWWPGEPMPENLRQHVERGGTMSFHNAGFEHAIWTRILTPRYGWAPVKLEQLDDTAARARRCGLPGALDKAAIAAGIVQQKDSAGSRLMKQMARPRKIEEDGTIIWWDTPEKIERLHAYGEQDYRTQMALHLALPLLPPKEWEIWQATFRANARGAALDMPFVRKALDMVAIKLDAYAQELLSLTNGQVKSHTDLNGMKAFLRGQGIEVDSLDKNVVASLIAEEDIPASAKRVVQIRSEAGKSSVAKFPAMQLHAGRDGIARDLLVYYGAIATGRWSGAGIQFQNLPARGAVGYADAEGLIRYALSASASDCIALSELLHDGSAVETLSMCLRGVITARPGKEIVCADFSNIEGRVGAWLGGEEWKLDAFRAYDNKTGPDLYIVTAAGILGKVFDAVTKTERNVMGKVPELALLFGGGVGAFVSMGDVYGIDMRDYVDTVRANMSSEVWAQATENYDTFGKAGELGKAAWIASESIKLAWRERHPGIKQAWYDCGNSAVLAIRNPGTVHHACKGKLSFMARYMFGKLFLLMRLPSGRCVHYANVSLRDKRTPWGAVKPTIYFDKVEGGRILRTGTHGGDIFQTATQGTARDMMAQGWLNVEEAEYVPLFSVHDELASECVQGLADLPRYERLLSAQEEWAAGCPVAAEGYVAPKFRKD